MTEEHGIYLEKKPPTNLTFMAFTRDHDEADAVKRYTEKYGQPPANIIRDRWVIYLGPIPKGDEK